MRSKDERASACTPHSLIVKGNPVYGRRATSVLSDPTLYNNRELSLLEFNQRILEEAQDPSNPILERLRFLCIVASNLDEFFEVELPV